MWIVLPILAFFMSVNATYAYFTASASKQEATTTTGIIRIVFTDETSGLINSQPITDSVKVLPGDTLSVSGAVKNSGNASCYAILELKVEVKRTGESDAEAKRSKFYTFVGSTLTEIEEIENGYNAVAFTLAVNETKNISFSYEFDVYEYDNTYKNASATYSLTAHAIQTANLNDTTEVTRMLIEG